LRPQGGIAVLRLLDGRGSSTILSAINGEGNIGERLGRDEERR